MTFGKSQLEVDCWEQDLTTAGRPVETVGKIFIHPDSLVSSRSEGFAPLGFALFGGVAAPSEEFILEVFP